MPDIALMGAVYPDVPAVTLPRSGGGNATYSYVEPDAKTADMTQPVCVDGNGKLWTAPGGGKKLSISLSSTWSGNGPYTQTVTLSGYTVTANSKVDIQPDSTVIAQLIADGVSALYIENNNGTLTAYAIGAAPMAALTIQCTVTEVAV